MNVKYKDDSLKTFTGFYIKKKSKDRLEEMAIWFHERGMIVKPTYSEAARKCLDIGWTIVSEAVEKAGEGKHIETVTFKIPQITIPQESDESEFL